jgi:hypothetical protein
MVYDRLSNAWPVNSGVLIHEGVAYFIAGLTDRDGTLAYALDAATGEPRWVNPNLGWIEKDRRAGLNCNGYLTVFDGRLRFNSGSKRQAALDLETGRPIPFPVQPRILIDGDRAVTTGIGHVKDGLLVRGGNRAFYGPDERLARGVRFSFKLPGDGAESMFAVAPYQSSNVMPVWDEASLFVARHDRFEKTLQAWDIGATEQWVRDVVASKAASPERQIRFTLSTERLGAQNQPKPVWSKDMEVVGLAVAEDALLVVSTAFENKRTRSGRQSWTLHALRKTSGEKLWSVALPGPPAISPLAIRADGSVLVALQDGYVLGIGRMAKPETGREQSKVSTSEVGPR